MNDTTAALHALAHETGTSIELLDPRAEGLSPFGEAARALARDATRTTSHLGLGHCDSVVAECSDGWLAIRIPGEGEPLLVVAARGTQPLGLSEWVAGRAAALTERGQG